MTGSVGGGNTGSVVPTRTMSATVAPAKSEIGSI